MPAFLPPEWGKSPTSPAEPSAPADVEVEAEEDATVEDTEDGGAIITLEDDSEEQGDSDFMANLAENLESNDRKALASELIEMVKRDKESRKRRDEQYEEGIRRTGLGDDAPGGAEFTGASKVVHPIMAEACVDFSARMMKELFPPNGPVREKIIGKPTREKMARANRKRDHMNWQLTEEVVEYRREMEQALTQVPLGGSQYIKWWWDDAKRRPCAEFVPIDNLYLPFACTGLETATRITHCLSLDAHEFERRVESGLYLDPEVTALSTEPEESASEKATDKIEGREPTGYNEDGLRTDYEMHLYWKFEWDDRKLPYIVTVDEAANDIIAIYRNWDEEDETQQRLEWFVELPFIPWRGAYCIGLPHLIGGLSAALTGSLRALLDSAHIANFPGALKLKGARISGGNNQIDPTQVLEVEAPPGTTDIRQVMMPLTLAAPNPVLAQLLDWLSNAAKGVVTTAEEKIADATGQMPVGTALALIEQGSKVFSSIHARLHEAQKQSLKILHRLNATYLTKEIKFGDDDVFIKPDDYKGPMDVIPVSDPNIFSETQRFAQMQAVAQRAAAMPQMYNLRRVEERILDMMKVPNKDDLLIPMPEPKPMNAVNENLAMVMSKPVLAFPNQDHEAHLATHLDFLVSPAFGSNILMAQSFIPACLEHLKQHMVFWYANGVYMMTESAAGMPPEALMSQDPKVAQEFDQLLANISQSVVQIGTARVDEIMPAIQQAIQLMQSMRQAPVDPNLISAQAQVDEVKRRAADDQSKAQIEMATLQSKAEAEAQQNALKVAELQAKVADAQRKAEIEQGIKQQEAAAKLLELQSKLADAETKAQQAQLKAQQDMMALRAKLETDLTKAQIAADTTLQVNRQDNTTAMAITSMRIEADEATGNLSTGAGLTVNPSPRGGG